MSWFCSLAVKAETPRVSERPLRGVYTNVNGTAPGWPGRKDGRTGARRSPPLLALAFTPLSSETRSLEGRPRPEKRSDRDALGNERRCPTRGGFSDMAWSGSYCGPRKCSCLPPTTGDCSLGDSITVPRSHS